MNKKTQTIADLFLDTVTVLPVRDIAESTAWYEQALAFETVYLHEGDESGEATNYAILRRGAVTMHLILDEPPPHRRAWTQAGTGYLYIIVGDVAAVYGELQSRKVEISRPLQTELWGARAFELMDPSGNAIHIEEG